MNHSSSMSPVCTELFESIVLRQWPKSETAQRIAKTAVYVGLAALPSYGLSCLILEMPQSSYILAGIMAFGIVPPVVALFGVGIWKRRHTRDAGVGVRWSHGAVFILVAGLVLEGYLPFVNAIGVAGKQVEYSGIVHYKEMVDKFPKGGQSNGGFTTALVMIPFRLVFGSWQYHVEIDDTATNQRIIFNVSNWEFESVRKGDRFSRRMRCGLLGIPYRWAWDRASLDARQQQR